MEKESDVSQLINYLKEKDISLDKIKSLIDTEVDSALEKLKVEEEEVPEEPILDVDLEPEEPEVPTFSIEDVKKLVTEEVRKSLKIKRKVPSKGRTIKPEDVPTDKDIIKKNWFEALV